MSVNISRSLLKQITDAEEINDATNLKIEATGVEFDSRNIRGGEVFVALPGEQVHGNSFIRSALDRGAALVIAEKGNGKDGRKDNGDQELQKVLEVASEEECQRILLCKDSLEAFSKLAHWWREQLQIPTIAVTGSVGKTTVKEMLASILLRDSRGNFSQKSFNNHTGVPYTILKTSREHQWLVLEMGMNHAGELTQLSKIGSPNHIIITKIAAAHIGNFGSLEGIAQAKLEIVAGLKPGGRVLLNGDDELLMSEYKRLNRADGEVALFGASVTASHEGPTCRVSEVTSLGLEGIKFQLHLKDAEGVSESCEVRMRILGRHHALNAAAAALGAKSLLPRITVEQIRSGLERFVSPPMRVNITRLANDKVVIDDSYNANLESMAGVLTIAEELKSIGKRLCLVIGDMLEQGSFAAELHQQVADKALKVAPDLCISVGNDSRVVAETLKAAGKVAVHVSKAEEAIPLALAAEVDVFIIKGSRGIGLDKVSEALKSDFGVKQEGDWKGA